MSNECQAITQAIQELSSKIDSYQNSVEARLAGLKSVDEESIIRKSVQRSEASIIPQIPNIAGAIAATVAAKQVAPVRALANKSLEKAFASEVKARAAKSAADIAQKTGNNALSQAGQALSKYAALAASVAALVASIATLLILGNRIDAVENGLTRLGADVSGILGRLLGIKTTAERADKNAGIALTSAGAAQAAAGSAQSTANNSIVIAREASSTATVAKSTADNAQSAADRASASAGEALTRSISAESIANNADSKAKSALTTANEADRKASSAQSTANEADRKASSAQTTADKALTGAGEALGKATSAQSTAQEAQNKAGVAQTTSDTALEKALEALRTKSIPGKDGLPGRDGQNGERGPRGFPGFNGLPGRDGQNGERGPRGFPGFNGLPGRDGQNGERGLPGFSRPGRPGKDGKDGKDGKMDKQQYESLLNRLTAIPPLIAAVPNNTVRRMPKPLDFSQTQAAASAGVCRTTQPGGCMSNALGNTANTVNQNTNNWGKNLLDKLNAGANAAQLALLQKVDLKLGAQITGGLSGAVKNIFENKLVDRALAVANLAGTFHNALMLSNNLAQTLFSATDNILNAVGMKIKDEKGAEIGIKQVVDSLLLNFANTLFGAENVTALNAQFKKANRVYQSASNVVDSVRSMTDSVKNVAEFAAENTGRIGNALKTYQVISPNAYSWMPEQVNAQSVWIRRLENLEEAASGIEMVSGEVLSITQNANEIKEQLNEFKKGIQNLPPKILVDNKPIRNVKVVQEAASTFPAIPEIRSDADKERDEA